MCELLQINTEKSQSARGCDVCELSEKWEVHETRGRDGVKGTVLSLFDERHTSD